MGDGSIWTCFGHLMASKLIRWNWVVWLNLTGNCTEARELMIMNEGQPIVLHNWWRNCLQRKFITGSNAQKAFSRCLSLRVSLRPKRFTHFSQIFVRAIPYHPVMGVDTDAGSCHVVSDHFIQFLAPHSQTQTFLCFLIGKDVEVIFNWQHSSNLCRLFYDSHMVLMRLSDYVEWAFWWDRKSLTSFFANFHFEVKLNRIGDELIGRAHKLCGFVSASLSISVSVLIFHLIGASLPKTVDTRSCG